MSSLKEMGERAKHASCDLKNASSGQKNSALSNIAWLLRTEEQPVLTANEKDIQIAIQNGMSSSMLDRLTLDSTRIQAMAAAIDSLIRMPDPIGVVLEGKRLPNGLDMIKRSVPLGVVGMIYEARPNVTVDSAVLCLKSGNCCILRGGKEAIHTNTALVRLLQRGLEDAGLPIDCIQLIEDTSHQTAVELMTLKDYLDVLIPRGGKNLIQSVVQNATVPVIETGAGVCHTYIDKHADISMGISIALNSKASRPSVCNAMETLLIHQAVAPEFLELFHQECMAKNIELRGCEQTVRLLGNAVSLATQEDWSTEYGDLILSVRVVSSMQKAIQHIEKYSTHHSECIVTKNYLRAQIFTDLVDSAVVYVNSSTRFTDGEEFGLGAEIGISTQKLHARGPMGLSALTSYKYILSGNGHIR